MNESLGKNAFGEHPPVSRAIPLKSRMSWTGGIFSRHQPSGVTIVNLMPDLNILAERSRQATVAQLATALRMQGLDEESQALLNMVEALYIAGEILFHDCIARVQNLFPRQVQSLDVSLRQKITLLSAQ